MKFFAFAAIVATAFASAAHSEEDKERLLATWAAQRDAGTYSEDTYNLLVQKLSEEEDSLDLAQTSVDADSLSAEDKEAGRQVMNTMVGYGGFANSANKLSLQLQVHSFKEFLKETSTATL